MKTIITSIIMLLILTACSAERNNCHAYDGVRQHPYMEDRQ